MFHLVALIAIPYFLSCHLRTDLSASRFFITENFVMLVTTTTRIGIGIGVKFVRLLVFWMPSLGDFTCGNELEMRLIEKCHELLASLHRTTDLGGGRRNRMNTCVHPNPSGIRSIRNNYAFLTFSQFL